MDGRLQDFRGDFTGAVSIGIVRLTRLTSQNQACAEKFFISFLAERNKNPVLICKMINPIGTLDRF
jgi:hypothetical protein